MKKAEKLIYIKRKQSGGGQNWGAGWDDLLKEYWDDLEKIWEDNLYGRHDVNLVNKTVKNVQKIIEEKAITRMEKYCQETNQNDGGWNQKAKNILGYFKTAKSTSDKVIALNAAEQFLRATET